MSEKENIPREGSRVTFWGDGCFVCGEKNPVGLHLKFDLDRETRTARSRVVFSAEYQGWDGVVHGGLLASVLDDAMAYAVMTTDKLGMTTRMTTTYREPVMVGEVLYLEGRVEKLGSRTAKTSAKGYVLENGGGSRVVKVEAEGIYYLDHPTGDEKK